MQVLGVNGGNGVLLHKLKPFLIGNYEPRQDFYIKNTTLAWDCNFPNILQTKDFEHLKNYLGDKRVDVIIGCPDCGHSSVMSYSRIKRLSNPLGNDSLQRYFEAIRYFQPKIFFFENLPTLLKQLPLEYIKDSVPGYKLKIFMDSVSAWGNSQITRKRLVIIGVKTEAFKAIKVYLKLPSKESYKLKRVKELEYAYRSPNIALCHVRESKNKVVCIEKDFKKLKLWQVREEWLRTGNKNWDARTTGKGKMITLPGVYRNLPNHYPRTVRPASRQFNSRGYMMTPRELAAINGIPDDFILYYDPEKHSLCINKAMVTAAKTAPYEMGTWFSKILLKLYRKGLV